MLNARDGIFFVVVDDLYVMRQSVVQRETPNEDMKKTLKKLEHSCLVAMSSGTELNFILSHNLFVDQFFAIKSHAIVEILADCHEAVSQATSSVKRACHIYLVFSTCCVCCP